jgi:CheY-like chemotaxis protein/two-component sensor histidine kinase
MSDDLDARKRLIHSDRLASLGVLAAGVAHEINNPAAFILLGTQQLARMVQQLPEDLASRPRMQEIVADIQEGVQRIARIVGELRFFARSEEEGLSTPVDVNDLIRSALTLTQAQLRHRGKIQTDLQPVPWLSGENLRLVQVFVNLLVNAAQALPPGAEDRNEVCVDSCHVDDFIIVRVRDTGVGIAPEHLPRVFDMFFTTKAPGEGTGLGLAIAHDLVQRAGGRIEIQSTVGLGTTVSVFIPVDHKHVSHPVVPAPAQTAETPVVEPASIEPLGLELLIIEDEHPLAAAITRALSPRFRVHHVGNGLDAVKLLTASEPGRFAVILCDLRLPGVDGATVFRTVQEQLPEVAQRFVFLTGVSANDAHSEFLRSSPQPVLVKPFRTEALDGVLASVLKK